MAIVSAYRVQQQRVVKQAATIRRLRRSLKKLSIAAENAPLYASEKELQRQLDKAIETANRALAETA